MNRHARHLARVAIALLPAVVPSSSIFACAQSRDARDSATRTVERIRHADYDGDRPALQRLHEELAQLGPLAEDRQLASRVRYWQGFAMWRRAFNGFSESAGPEDLARDLEQAVRDFEEALRHDTGFVDAKVGAISCLQNLAYLHRKDAARVRELVPRFVRLVEESLAAAPENPRLLWVQGASQFWNPPERGGGQARALATYEQGLQLARKHKGTVRDSLEPSWGEAELLTNLAWTHLNRATPDVRAAEDYARQALALVPHWHYLRDILMVQIRDAKDKQ